jgi:hypothetical protein
MPRCRLAALPWPLLLALALAGCQSMSVGSLWPFGDSEIQEKDRRPANAAEYRCSDGKSFYVRNLEGGAVWLIAPDRDVRLEKLAEGRYGVGRVSLELSGGEATLTDPPSVFVNCKRAG